MIPENTAQSALIAQRSGADVVEIDVSVTTDGGVYAFHDGLERHLLGCSTNLTEQRSDQVDQLRYAYGQLAGRPMRVQRLEQVLLALRGTSTEVHLDRAWRWWPQVLPVLARLDMDDQLVIKTPASDACLADLLRAEPTPRVAAICTDAAQVQAALEAAVPVHILELVQRSVDDTTADLVGHVHRAGRLTMVNAEVVGAPLWGGLDDERSVLEDPADGWGRLIGMGFDYVQTDFPWLFVQYRDSLEKGGSGGGSALHFASSHHG